MQKNIGRLSLGEKLEILKVIDENKDKSKNELAELLNINTSTLNSIIKSRSEFEDNLDNEDELTPERKRLKVEKNNEIEILLMAWLKSVKQPINTDILKSKAEETAQLIGCSYFTPTTSWIDDFKSKFGIVCDNTKTESNENNQSSDSNSSSPVNDCAEASINSEKEENLDIHSNQDGIKENLKANENKEILNNNASEENSSASITKDNFSNKTSQRNRKENFRISSNKEKLNNDASYGSKENHTANLNKEKRNFKLRKENSIKSPNKIILRNKTSQEKLNLSAKKERTKTIPSKPISRSIISNIRRKKERPRIPIKEINKKNISLRPRKQIIKEKINNNISQKKSSPVVINDLEKVTTRSYKKHEESKINSPPLLKKMITPFKRSTSPNSQNKFKTKSNKEIDKPPLSPPKLSPMPTQSNTPVSLSPSPSPVPYPKNNITGQMALDSLERCRDFLKLQVKVPIAAYIHLDALEKHVINSMQNNFI